MGLHIHDLLERSFLGFTGRMALLGVLPVLIHLHAEGVIVAGILPPEVKQRGADKVSVGVRSPGVELDALHWALK